MRKRRVDILYIYGRTLGIFMHLRTLVPHLELGVPPIRPQSVVRKLTHGSQIACIQPSLGECKVGLFFCTSLLWERSRNVMPLHGICALPFYLLTVYHGVESLQLGPFSLDTTQCYLGLILDEFCYWKSRSDRLQWSFHFLLQIQMPSLLVHLREN